MWSCFPDVYTAVRRHKAWSCCPNVYTAVRRQKAWSCCPNVYTAVRRQKPIWSNKHQPIFEIFHFYKYKNDNWSKLSIDTADYGDVSFKCLSLNVGNMPPYKYEVVSHFWAAHF